MQLKHNSGCHNYLIWIEMIIHLLNMLLTYVLLCIVSLARNNARVMCRNLGNNCFILLTRLNVFSPALRGSSYSRRRHWRRKFFCLHRSRRNGCRCRYMAAAKCVIAVGATFPDVATTGGVAAVGAMSPAVVAANVAVWQVSMKRMHRPLRLFLL